MSLEIIVANTKHGTILYDSATACVADRIEDGNYYWDQESLEAASSALEKGEDASWKFLLSRNDHEYEYVEAQTVQS